MLKKTVLILLTLVLSLALVLPVYAFQAKVSKVDGKIVTLSADESLPSWLKKGVLTKTSSGLGKIKAVDGNQFDMKVKKSTAAKLKSGDLLEVEPKSSGGGQKLQGC